MDITYFAGGPNYSPEGLNQGYTHGFLMTFESVEARDSYLPHPEHEAVKAALSQCIDSVLVFDLEATAIAHLTNQLSDWSSKRC